MLATMVFALGHIKEIVVVECIAKRMILIGLTDAVTTMANDKNENDIRRVITFLIANKAIVVIF